VRPSYNEALNDLVHALQHTCDWQQWAAAFKKVESALAMELAAGALPLFVKPFHALVYPLKPQHMLLVARAYAARAVRLTKSLQPVRDMSLPPMKKCNVIKSGAAAYMDPPASHATFAPGVCVVEHRRPFTHAPHALCVSISRQPAASPHIRPQPQRRQRLPQGFGRSFRISISLLL
jgi:hypothetical protein